MKVILLGDSIRMPETGYGKIVEKVLREKGYDVFQPEDNCRFAKNMLRMLFDYRSQLEDADVIHFNVGHWDLCTINSDNTPFSSIDEYKDNLERIAKLLLKITPHVIFATTTPVRKENPYQNNEIVERYNKAAIEVMNKLGIKINDLYHSISDDVDKYILGNGDYIHPTEIGKEILAKQVIKVIEEEMKKGA